MRFCDQILATYVIMYTKDCLALYNCTALKLSHGDRLRVGLAIALTLAPHVHSIILQLLQPNDVGFLCVCVYFTEINDHLPST